MIEKTAGKTVILFIVLAACASLFLLGGSDKSEQRMQSTLEETLEEMEGIGRVAVYFHYAEQEAENSLAGYFSLAPEKKAPSQPLIGLLVAAQGADDPAVRNRLSKVLANVLQLPEHRIVIVEMKKEGEPF